MKTSKIPPTVEEKAEHKSFFTKRNIVILVVATIVSLGLAATTIVGIFGVDMWKDFFVHIGRGLTVNLGSLWLSILIAFALLNIAYNMIPVYLRLKQMGVKIGFFQWLGFSLTISFLRAVTPANFVYDPYTVFWLKTRGVSTARATSIMFSNALLWQSAVLIIHIPSFAIIMAKSSLLTGPLGMFIIVTMAFGLIVDAIGVLFMALLCFSRRAHIVISRIFNWIKKKLHLRYSSKAEIIEKYKNKAIMKKEVIEYYKDWSTTLVIVFVLVSYEIIVYFTLSCSLALINADNIFTFDPVYVYHSSNMAFNANRLNIIPGFGVYLEVSLCEMLRVLGGIGSSTGDAEEQQDFIKQGIVLWRAFYTYIPAVLGLIGFGGLTIAQVRAYRKNKSSFIQEKYE